MHAPSTRSAAARRRRRAIGVVAVSLGLVATLQGTDIAAALGAGSDGTDGPVSTDPGASSLLESLSGAGDDIATDRSTIQGRDGKAYWLENHVDTTALPPSVLDGLDLPSLPGGLGGGDAGGTVPDDGVRREYLVVWAGDNNVLDKSGAELTTLPKSVGTDLIGQKDLVGPDFFAVVDATKGSPSYGKVVNTATVGPLVENEPHHMQYIWHKGDNIFAGGLFTDVDLRLRRLAAAEADAVGRQPAHRHALRLGARTPTGCSRTAPRTAPTWAARTCPGPCTYTDGERPDRQRLRRLARRARPPRQGRQDALARRRPRPRPPEDPSSAATTSPPLPRPDLRQPARHPGPRGPRHAWSPATTPSRATSSSTRCKPPSSYLRRPHRPHLGHQRPRPPEARVGVVPAGRPAPSGKVPHHEEPRAASWRPRSPTCPATRARSPRRCRAASSTTRPTSPPRSRSGARSSTTPPPTS